MFLAHIMKHPLFGAFQNSAKRFSGIVMNIAAYILFVAVVNPIMSSKLFTNKAIGAVSIRNQIGVFIDKALYLREKLSDFVTGHRYSPHRTVAFNGYQYSLLVGAFAAFVFHSLLITGFAANIFFIQFNHAAKRRQDLRTGVHHLAHRMAQFPGAFLRDANPFGQNDRGDAFA
jgi:hypothetical protein